MSECFDIAAVRHFRDGGLLSERGSVENADQLFGFAAECAIKSALVTLPGCNQGGVLSEKYREHVDRLWDLAVLQGRQRRYPGLFALLRGSRYRLLFEHLSKSRGVRFGMPDNDLRWRLKMAAAQVEKTEGAVASCLDASYDTWSALYDDEGKDSEGNPAVTFIRDDPSAPHYPLVIYYDAGLRGIELVDTSRRPPWSVIETAFGEFLAGATTRLLASNRTLGDVSQMEA